MSHTSRELKFLSSETLTPEDKEAMKRVYEKIKDITFDIRASSEIARVLQFYEVEGFKLSQPTP